MGIEENMPFLVSVKLFVEGSKFLRYIILSRERQKQEKKQSPFCFFPKDREEGRHLQTVSPLVCPILWEILPVSHTHPQKQCTIQQIYLIYTEEKWGHTHTHSDKHTLSLGRANIHACQVEWSIQAEDTGVHESRFFVVSFDGVVV